MKDKTETEYFGEGCRRLNCENRNDAFKCAGGSKNGTCKRDLEGKKEIDALVERCKEEKKKDKKCQTPS